MCSRISGFAVLLLEDSFQPAPVDRRALVVDDERYTGYFLRGTRQEVTFRKLSEELGYMLRSRLERFYQVDFCISRQQASTMLHTFPNLIAWSRSINNSFHKSTSRKYERSISNDSRRSWAFVAAEFCPEAQSGVFDGYYRSVAWFLEHFFIKPISKGEGYRILVIVDWVKNCLRRRRQGQVYIAGARNSASFFQPRTVED